MSSPKVNTTMENAMLLVIGAGVNGPAVATRLCNADRDTKVFARGKNYEGVRDEGNDSGSLLR